MRKLLFAVALTISGPSLAQTVYVKPHVTRDGTYVPGHWRTAPNKSTADNWSTAPNVNTYTGEIGDQPSFPTHPVYRPRQPLPRATPSPSPFSESTQERMRQTMPLTCKYNDFC